MAKAITAEGTFSNTEATVRQRLSRMFDDCVLLTASAGTTTTYTVATAEPPQFYDKGDDYFNNEQYEAYCYGGINIGASRVCDDWVNSTRVLTVTPAAAAAYTTASKLELHSRFFVSELRSALNQAIAFYRNKYFIDLSDSTTITLTRTARNDVSTSYIYTYEYALPTDCLYLWRVTTEASVSGVKLTGTVSDTFTLGEQVVGDSSGATGLVSYSGATYIRVREVSGTFTTADTATGQSSSETVSTITAIAYEPAGDGTFPESNVIDPRDWRILKPYAPKIKLHEGHCTVVEDLRLNLEYQGIQDIVDADTDTIFINPDELCEVAATFLPFSKIESNNLNATFERCLNTRRVVEQRPPMHPYPNACKCW